MAKKQMTLNGALKLNETFVRKMKEHGCPSAIEALAEASVLGMTVHGYAHSDRDKPFYDEVSATEELFVETLTQHVLPTSPDVAVQAFFNLAVGLLRFQEEEGMAAKTATAVQ
jgi:hypothetical protein